MTLMSLICSRYFTIGTAAAATHAYNTAKGAGISYDIAEEEGDESNHYRSCVSRQTYMWNNVMLEGAMYALVWAGWPVYAFIYACAAGVHNYHNFIE